MFYKIIDFGLNIKGLPHGRVLHDEVYGSLYALHLLNILLRFHDKKNQISIFNSKTCST